MKKTIIIFSDYYLPGFKAGGPIKSISNLVQNLENYFNFVIITRDRDLNDELPYDPEKIKKLHESDRVEKIIYTGPGNINLLRNIKIAKQIKPDIIYFNSFFSKKYTILPILFFIFFQKKINIILAPRGELKDSAIKNKETVKNLYITFFRKFVAKNRRIEFHATSDEEAADIKNKLGSSIKIHLAPALPKRPYNNHLLKVRNNKKLKIVFASRITPIKNLDYAIEIINNLNINFEFLIAGPIGDKNYWEKCKELIDPQTTKYVGALPPMQLEEFLQEADLLFLPTQGENFGHIIAESLSVGTPVIISDQTPWKNLVEKKIGFSIPLAEKQQFIDSINFFYSLNNSQRFQMREKCFEYFKLSASPETIERNKNLFF